MLLNMQSNIIVVGNKVTESKKKLAKRKENLSRQFSFCEDFVCLDHLRESATHTTK